MSKCLQDSMIGALVADAVSMPVHWYYNTQALDRDYPDLSAYVAPSNPHPDSILWRSKYTPRNKALDILHDQAKYWGKRDIHYHQFLPAGGNTLNFLLGVQLYRLMIEGEGYFPKAWLHLYIECMRTPGWHKDTYVEEYHRAFFDNLASGRRPDLCGIKDIHIGGLAPVPFLVAALDRLEESSPEDNVDLVLSHLALTHQGREVASAGAAFARILYAIDQGETVHQAISSNADGFVSAAELDTWSSFEDRVVVGRHLTSACYLPESFVAALFLVWKYHDDFTEGVIANARCGGDNAHRGAVVGALLGAGNGVPSRWLKDLKSIEQLPLELDELSV